MQRRHFCVFSQSGSDAIVAVCVVIVGAVGRTADAEAEVGRCVGAFDGVSQWFNRS